MVLTFQLEVLPGGVSTDHGNKRAPKAVELGRHDTPRVPGRAGDDDFLIHLDPPAVKMGLHGVYSTARLAQVPILARRFRAWRSTPR